MFPPVEEDVAEISKPYRFPRLAKNLGVRMSKTACGQAQTGCSI
jgi:hypothetical protein